MQGELWSIAAAGTAAALLAALADRRRTRRRDLDRVGWVPWPLVNSGDDRRGGCRGAGAQGELG